MSLPRSIEDDARFLTSDLLRYRLASRGDGFGRKIKIVVVGFDGVLVPMFRYVTLLAESNESIPPGSRIAAGIADALARVLLDMTTELSRRIWEHPDPIKCIRVGISIDECSGVRVAASWD